MIRRIFLKSSLGAAAGAAFTLSGTRASSKVLEANDTTCVTMMGIHGLEDGNVGIGTTTPDTKLIVATPYMSENLLNK